MKLTILTLNLTPGGAEKQIVQLVKYWSKARKDINIDILLLTYESFWIKEVKNCVNLIYLSNLSQSEAMDRGYLKKLIWGMKLIPDLKAYFKSNKPDIILTFLWFPTLLAVLLKPKKTSIVWSIQSDLQEVFKTHSDSLIRKLLTKNFFYNRIDFFLPLSTGLSKKLKNWLKLPEEKVKIVPNSIDFQEIFQKLKCHKENIPPKEKKFRIVSVGRFEIAKGMDIFLKSLSILPEHLKKDLEVYLVGDGNERERLESLKQYFNLTNIVKFVGFKKNPYPWIASADLFVLSSRWETFGIAIAEAMALGVPVIATETDGARDLVVHNKTGILVPVENEKALAQAIEYLLLREDLRIIFSKTAKERIKNFSIEKIAKKYEEVFMEVLKNK